jgi:hypothetical protein
LNGQGRKRRQKIIGGDLKQDPAFFFGFHHL